MAGTLLSTIGILRIVTAGVGIDIGIGTSPSIGAIRILTIITTTIDLRITITHHTTVA